MHNANGLWRAVSAWQDCRAGRMTPSYKTASAHRRVMKEVHERIRRRGWRRGEGVRCRGRELFQLELRLRNDWQWLHARPPTHRSLLLSASSHASLATLHVSKLTTTPCLCPLRPTLRIFSGYFLPFTLHGKNNLAR